jgi:hypothetical protein
MARIRRPPKLRQSSSTHRPSTSPAPKDRISFPPERLVAPDTVRHTFRIAPSSASPGAVSNASSLFSTRRSEDPLAVRRLASLPLELPWPLLETSFDLRRDRQSFPETTLGKRASPFETNSRLDAPKIISSRHHLIGALRESADDFLCEKKLRRTLSCFENHFGFP